MTTPVSPLITDVVIGLLDHEFGIGTGARYFAYLERLIRKYPPTHTWTHDDIDTTIIQHIMHRPTLARGPEEHIDIMCGGLITLQGLFYPHELFQLALIATLQHMRRVYEPRQPHGGFQRPHIRKQSHASL